MIVSLSTSVVGFRGVSQQLQKIPVKCPNTRRCGKNASTQKFPYLNLVWRLGWLSALPSRYEHVAHMFQVELLLVVSS